MALGSERKKMGLWGAVNVGLGAIVGGGILALAGVAFATTGPSTILAFAGNGVIALLTVLSFAELSARFPESGGTYTFARKVLTVEAAFAVGWVVWFASVVASVLYALGFAAFLVPVLEQIWRTLDATPPAWISNRFSISLYALSAIGFYIWSLSHSTGQGKSWATLGKMLMFGIILAGGAFVLIVRPPTTTELATSFQPFFSRGGRGLIQAMGYTFIALQGFDLIAAVSGEVRKPEQTVPRAMLISLALALLVYLPLLFFIITVGTPNQPVAEAAKANPDILVAIAARNFLGPTGYWLVIIAGVLSMLSALHANLYAASRFALTMANDRTLPPLFGRIMPDKRTPVPAIRLTGAMVALVLIAVPNLAAAGAMSSLIFLASFALAHGIAYLVRRRVGASDAFKTPAFPLIPILGGTACIALALFQALAVPTAGVLVALWLSIGAGLFATRLGSRARIADASAEAFDPQLVRFRGRKPLVLVPIANPANAETIMTMATALAPDTVARILLLSVVQPPKKWISGDQPRQLIDAQSVLGSALSSAFASQLAPEALVTIGANPWKEITRIAGLYQCESLLLGFGNLEKALMTGPLENLISDVNCDVVILRAPSQWDLNTIKKILVPTGGRSDQSSIRARLVGNLCRAGKRDITFLQIMPEKTSTTMFNKARRDLEHLTHDNHTSEDHQIEIVRRDDIVAEIVEQAKKSDLLILGLKRLGRRNKVFGELVLEIAKRTKCPLMMISQRS